MNIVMLTNTYLPHVGGVARSVQAFSQKYRELGHQVLVIAPEFPNAESSSADVIRVPAIQNFNGSDFSVRLPIPGSIGEAFSNFGPHIIHAHHPFLLGDTAVRLAARENLPLVFTHHTMYEQYTHYVPGDSRALKRFAIELSTGYANLCDQVITPSESVQGILLERGVTSPITTIPTGVDVEHFASGNRNTFRKRFSLNSSTVIIGHVGRLAAEKNLIFLTHAVKRALTKDERLHFLVAGSGPAEDEMKKIFSQAGLGARVHFAGVCQGSDLVDVFAAMDLFAFASKSETQGMVLTEAMAAGLPVVAIDAPGAREVVSDGSNGHLLLMEDAKEFSEALLSIAHAPAEQYKKMREAARQTADSFSITNTAKKALETYQAVIERARSLKDVDESVWLKSSRLIEKEWALWTNTVEALNALVKPQAMIFGGPLRKLRTFRRKMRKYFSQSEYLVEFLRLSRSESRSDQPGILFIQIDGLSRRMLEQALTTSRMPFIRKLLSKQHYKMYSFYSGLPSTTPAVQGELFYGVKGCVPSFSYYDRGAHQLGKMLHTSFARRVQRRLAASGQGLLEGGSSYSNVYSGGAREASFCSVQLGISSALNEASLWRLVLTALIHIRSIVRIIVLFIFEVFLAVSDCIWGCVKQERIISELKFVPSRVGICIALREFIRISASLDLARGLPTVHLNLLGYDEQSHRRGPTSNFAMWTLRGIDDAIRHLHRQALRSTAREYMVCIYSDHGQQEVIPFARETGHSLLDAVKNALEPIGSYEVSLDENYRGIQGRRSVLRKRSRVSEPKPSSRERSTEGGKRALVAALGPVGHLYLEEALLPEALRAIAENLVHQGVPAVLMNDLEGTALAMTAQGVFKLPEEVHMFVGTDHPFLDYLKEDLIRMCCHPDSGNLILCGWRINQKPVSFPEENGAHAGPGPLETEAFAILPSDIDTQSEKNVMRPADLRRAALQYLNRTAHSSQSARRMELGRMRIMTYNIHSCMGMDGALSPGRIAGVIGRYDPDLIALQEVDLGKSRSHNLDQAQSIANELGMHCYFFPTIKIEGELYGDAVLSKLPAHNFQADNLPTLPGMEPRGFVWLTFRWKNKNVHVINTHFGLRARERRMQIEALLGEKCVASIADSDEVILCGDFNALPRTFVYRQLAKKFTDVQLELEDHEPRRTSRYGRIDHIFTSRGIKTLGVQVPRSPTIQLASDHFPLIADIQV